MAATSLIGDERAVRDGLAALRGAGVTTVTVHPAGSSATERIAQVEAVRALLPG